MKKINIFIAMLGLFGLITQVQAKVAYGISQQETDPHLLIGEVDGEPGLGITLPIIGNKLFSASYLKKLATRDNNGVYRFKLENNPIVENQYIDIFQIPNTDIYFGEWAQKTPDKSDITHTVFYAGKDVTTNLPTGGTATYTVTGLNRYNGNNLLSGKFTADFGNKKLNGSLSNDSLNIDIDANINNDAGFSGKATANGNINGATDGKFYGDSASALAGYAKFDSDRTKDTAFGGTKQ
ncbi:transferrin-binding protein-like solute binding protein [Xenorhabdus sp. DI]|uniref:Slam-dependent surface lipoprotein n=1 Tax=Xenorhabdus doucetiae TaxID=351671 RepID=UPI00199937AE|nr:MULTISPECIES: Slam-dependent surface lipoprotein [unclassified Xenorhabdus]MBD2783070.1 transferrin-binding protein-like solute binding protein [Xenorhabdus sp. 3]MBD2788762.1 transferrin-binding protein-like solute binding protein [Xenorhabdus sp. DI]MBD2795734.1 transferrin-binding protein-like solute binding protein [Xenorhabdus sp. 18]